MRFMVIIKADKKSEAGAMPSEALLTAMGRFNEELVDAGVMMAGEGLHPSEKGVRVHFSGTKQTVTKGPFVGPEQLVAGFWLWQLGSMDEAIKWAKRAPLESGAEIEIRQAFEPEDFGAELAPRLRAQQERLRAHAPANH